jgi:hypothetical protein
MQALAWLRRARRGTARSVGVFVADVGRGFLEVSHNTLALVGLAAVAVLVFALGRAETRQELEAVALQWLQGRHEERELGQGNFLAFVAEPAAGARATAANPQQLPRAQAALATWIARRYKVAPEPVAALVQEAWSIGPARRAGPDADPGHHGRGVQLQPLCPEPGGRTGSDAGDDPRARRQVPGLWRHPRRL